MKLCSSQECTGCYACYNSCTHQALDMVRNDEGFFNPLFNEDKCTECGLCERNCPVLNPLKKQLSQQQYGYACWSNDKYIRRESTSGGFFTEVATIIINQGGIVVGAAFDDNFKLKHTIISENEELHRLRGSKYMQSQIDSVFIEIKSILKKDITVLFSGTPCQIAGLYSYLGKEYSNLYTLDFVCHGVPSSLIFDKYRKRLEDKYNDSITSYKFRDKRRSWAMYNIKATFASGKVYFGNWFKDPFLRLFLRDNILRESCYTCSYANMNRISDITIADFWNYIAQNKSERNTDEGISLVLTNSSKGQNLFNQCKLKLTYFERSIEIISKSQNSLSMPFPKPIDRELFWNDFNKLDFEDVITKYGFTEKRSIIQYIISEFGMTRFTKVIIWLIYKIDGIRHRFLYIIRKLLKTLYYS